MGNYIYKYFKKNKLVYIGKTSVDPYVRYRQHVKEEAAYDEIDKIEICECTSAVDMDVLELVLIAKYKPLWNVMGIEKGVPSFEIPIPVFEEYSPESLKRKFGPTNSVREATSDSVQKGDRGKRKRLRKKLTIDGETFWISGYSEKELAEKAGAKRAEVAMGKRVYAKTMSLNRWADDWFSLQEELHQGDEAALDLICRHRRLFDLHIRKKLGSTNIKNLLQMDVSRALLDISGNRSEQAETRALMECMLYAAYVNKLTDDGNVFTGLLGRMTSQDIKGILRSVHNFYLGGKPYWCHDYQDIPV